MADIESTFLKRFDETFRMLLVIGTITMTYSFNLYKEKLSVEYFHELLLFFILLGEPKSSKVKNQLGKNS